MKQSKTNPNLHIAKVENSESDFYNQLTEEEKIFIDLDDYMGVITELVRRKYKLTEDKAIEYVNSGIKKMYKI